MAFVTHGAQNFCDNPRATRDILVAITTSVLDCCFLGTLLRLGKLAVLRGCLCCVKARGKLIIVLLQHYFTSARLE